MTGDGRVVILEREFPSLAAYEADDDAFHGDADLMAAWRAMEALARSMRVELWDGPVWE